MNHAHVFPARVFPITAQFKPTVYRASSATRRRLLARLKPSTSMPTGTANSLPCQRRLVRVETSRATSSPLPSTDMAPILGQRTRLCLLHQATGSAPLSASSGRCSPRRSEDLTDGSCLRAAQHRSGTVRAWPHSSTAWMVTVGFGGRPGARSNGVTGQS